MTRKKRNYRYADAGSQICGKMQCCKCGKKITDGLYRYHETAEAYVSCHKACCPEDPQWLKIELQEKCESDRRKLFESDVLDFYDKWGELDDDEFMSIVINRPKST